MSLKKYYEDQDQDKLNTEDKHKWNVANTNFICIIVSIVTLFLALVSSFIFTGTNIDAVAYFGIVCAVIGFITFIISGILSLVVSALLIDIFKSNDNRKTEVVLAAVYLTLVALGIIGSIMNNNNNSYKSNFSINENGNMRWKNTNRWDD
jgi:ABC-type Mn2+/Zn2+ transport system permease subunit